MSSAPQTISAHQGEISCLALNSQGTFVATASDKGIFLSHFKDLLILITQW